MAKVQVYVTDNLLHRLGERGINTTKVCQEALEAAVDDASSPRAKLRRMRKLVRELEEALDAS